MRNCTDLGRLPRTVPGFAHGRLGGRTRVGLVRTDPASVRTGEEREQRRPRAGPLERRVNTLPQCLQGRRRIVPEAVLGGVVLGGDQNQTRGRRDAYDRPSVAYQLSKPTWPVFGARPATGRPVGGPRATRCDGGSGARACERQRRGVLKQEPPPLLQCEGNRRSPRAQRRDLELAGN